MLPREHLCTLVSISRKLWRREFSNFFKKFLFLKHFLFGSGFRFGSLQPIYINLIRDPLARLVSGYYFRRFGDYREGHRTWNFKGTDKEKNQVGLVWNISKLYLITLHNEWFYQKVLLPVFCGRSFAKKHRLIFIVGTLRSNDADGDENVIKTIGLTTKTTTLHVHHACLSISLAVFARLRRENT